LNWLVIQAKSEKKKKEKKKKITCEDQEAVPFCLFPPTRGLAFTLAGPGATVPFMSAPPSSPSIFTVLARRRLLLTLGLALALPTFCCIWP
jgi:hypothetical protein